MKVEAEEFLPVPPERAFGFLARWEEQSRWMRDADRIRVLGPSREGPGVRIAARTKVAGVPLFTDELEVVEWEAPRRIVVAHRRLVRGTGEWTLEPVEGGTKLRWTEDVSLGVPLLGELALIVYRPFMRRLMRRSLARLKGLLV